MNNIPVNCIHAECPNCNEKFDVIPPSGTTIPSPVSDFYLVEKEEGKEITQNAAAQNYAVNKTHPFNKLFTKLTDAFIAGVEWQKTIKS